MSRIYIVVKHGYSKATNFCCFFLDTLKLSGMLNVALYGNNIQVQRTLFEYCNDLYSRLRSIN